MDAQPKELKIVIVEDNVDLAEIYKTRLELIGYKCFVAHDGQQALEIIEREHPDLVLLDLMVPKIAGDQILERMRSSDWGKDIRVFIISNLNEVDAPKGLRGLGIEGYVVKANLSNDQLDQLVDKILKPRGQLESTSLETPGTIVKEQQDNPNPEQNVAEYQVNHDEQNTFSQNDQTGHSQNPEQTGDQNPQDNQNNTPPDNENHNGHDSQQSTHESQQHDNWG